jgi:hypothetical protein
VQSFPKIMGITSASKELYLAVLTSKYRLVLLENPISK